MSTIPSRDKPPMWGKNKPRTIDRDIADADQRIGHALNWLEARFAALREKANLASCRALVAGGDIGVRPQITALTLARALADTASRVILVDLSQSAGALSGPLELPRSPGLAELCQGKAGFEDVIHRDPVSKLHFLAPGKPRSLGGEWGEAGMLDKICRALDESYAFSLFCAEHEEALLLARTVRRPFAAGIVIREPRRGSAPAEQPADFASFGFPLYWLDQRA
jgi:hypothetical protein